MKAIGKVVFCFAISLLVFGCSMNTQLQSSDDTQWSSHYQAMHDQVQQSNPDMDHVLTFCDEMVRVATQYEQNAISKEQFLVKQHEMRALLQKEDEYRKQIAWQQEPGISPLEQYMQAQNSSGERIEEARSISN